MNQEKNLGRSPLVVERASRFRTECPPARIATDFRRLGICTQLIQAQHAWAADNEYQTIRFECNNQHRPMLHVAITEGYDLVGIRWDTASGNNVVIFEKDLT